MVGVAGLFALQPEYQVHQPQQSGELQHVCQHHVGGLPQLVTHIVRAHVVLERGEVNHREDDRQEENSHCDNNEVKKFTFCHGVSFSFNVRCFPLPAAMCHLLPESPVMFASTWSQAK